MKLWLDDRREAPIGWTWVKSYAEAVTLLKSGRVNEVSLDHDLGTKETGYDVACAIEKMHNGGEVVPMIVSHSSNPVGSSKINAVANRVRKPPVKRGRTALG